MCVAVAENLAKQIRQTRPFASPEQEALLAIRRTSATLLAPWEKFLKAKFGLSTSLFNVLRILRGSHPAPLTCGAIGERTIARDPDVTRLVDQLCARGLVTRSRSRADRRVVEVSITDKGLHLLRELDPHSLRMPRSLIGHVSAVKLRKLSALLAEVLDGVGTYP
jgi:DNA-binding MarR family transcriptional regulator